MQPLGLFRVELLAAARLGKFDEFGGVGPGDRHGLLTSVAEGLEQIEVAGAEVGAGYRFKRGLDGLAGVSGHG